jgi:GT2 family glycosyltransferase
MKKPRKDVAVIIINYNSSRFTLDCIESITSKTSADSTYEIIIVDNASKPEEVIQLKILEGHPHLQLIYSDVNLGFGNGNMLGAERTDARYLFFLNNDCVLLNDCLKILKDFCDNDSSVGLCGAQLYSEKSERIRSFGYLPTPALKFLGPAVLRLFAPKRYPKRDKEYKYPVKVDLVSGSGLFFSNTAFREIGGFDPNLFFYCEEEDLGQRLRKKKLHVYFVPDAKYIHFIGGSSLQNFVMLQEYYISLMYFFRKHYSAIAYFFLKLFYCIKFLKKSLKDKRYFPFVGFIFRGAPMKESLRYSR